MEDVLNYLKKFGLGIEFILIFIYSFFCCIKVIIFKNSSTIKNILAQKKGLIEQSFEIFKSKDYLFVLFLGIICILLLSIIIHFKWKKSTIDPINYIGMFIHIILLIVVIAIYWDPVLLTFGIICAIGLGLTKSL